MSAVSVVSSEPKTWTIEAVLRWSTDDFRARGIETPRLDAELLLGHALGCTRIKLFMELKRELGSTELASFKELVRRRRAREPVAYILGVREFYGRPFRVDPRVLVPRPDSETLVEVALERTRHVSMSMFALDLCTGSGCVGTTLARERPTARLLGTDVNDAALVVAQDNALRLGAYNIAFARSDLFDAVSEDSAFDLVTANPPYVSTAEVGDLASEIRLHEPHLALDGGPDGLSMIRRIVADAPRHLRPGGVLALEVGAGQALAVSAFFAAEHFQEIRSTRDLGGIERVVSGVLSPPPL